MNHPALKELLEYMDGELAPGVRARVALHLKACAPCREQLSSLAMASAELANAHTARSDQHSDALSQQKAALRARLSQITEARPEAKLPTHAWSKSLAYAAALILMTAVGWASFEHHRIASGHALPNPTITPGATRQVSLSEICTADDDEVVRSVPAAVQQTVFREYGLNRAQPGDFEVDYLITPGLGGSDAVTNLWPQPHRSQWNSYVKDQLEDHLHHMVCRGELPLSAAQHAIASNWIAAYKKYFQTDRPLADARPAAPVEAQIQRAPLLR